MYLTIKKKVRKHTPKPIWELLGRTKREPLRFLILKLAKSNNKFFKYLIKNKCTKLTWLDTIKPEKNFKENQTINVYTPNYNGKKKVEVERPKINLYKFNNARVHGESSHIILEHSVVMERLPSVPVKYCNYSSGFIESHDDSFSIYRNKYHTIEVDNAFFLGGNGSYNYYHWTVEVITKLKYFLSSNLSGTNTKIILPEHARNTESFSVMLDILLNGAFSFIYISRDQIAIVQELYLISSPSNVVLNTAKDYQLREDFFFFDKESIDFIREQVLNSWQYKSFLNGLDNKVKIKKVFLARKSSAERSYNQNEVIEVINNYGFKPIYLEELTFFEQVYLFQNVDYVIGASGAAWTNLIYINNGAKALSWLSENISCFSSYSTLAEYYDCELKFFNCKEDNEKNTHSNYVIDLHILEENIANNFL